MLGKHFVRTATLDTFGNKFKHISEQRSSRIMRQSWSFLDPVLVAAACSSFNITGPFGASGVYGRLSQPTNAKSPSAHLTSLTVTAISPTLLGYRFTKEPARGIFTTSLSNIVSTYTRHSAPASILHRTKFEHIWTPEAAM